MLKKSLATVLATLTTLNGFSTLFTVSTIVVGNSLLSSPATAADSDYSEAIKYLTSNPNLVSQVVTQVWNQGGKEIAAQKIAETLNGKQLRKGVSIYGVQVNLNKIQPSGVQLLNDGRQVIVRIAVPVSNVNFKTTTDTIFGSYADPSFRVGFNLNATLKISASNRITVDNVDVGVSNASIRGSNITGTLVESFADFFTKGRFSQDIVSRINGDYSGKDRIASYIQSAIDRYTPSNILTGQSKQPLVTNDKPYGVDTCKQGYVWREAQPNDRVCVTPAIRAQTRNENNLAAQRREPNGGAYGPNTCKQGYVWREATENDPVCVIPAVRAQAAEDNKRAGERRVP
jgi:hypothetical protein